MFEFHTINTSELLAISNEPWPSINNLHRFSLFGQHVLNFLLYLYYIFIIYFILYFIASKPTHTQSNPTHDRKRYEFLLKIIIIKKAGMGTKTKKRKRQGL